MAFSLFPTRRGSTRDPFAFRPTLECLEGRVTPSATSLMPRPVLGTALASVTPAASQQQSFAMLPLSITGISVQNGQLIANGLLGSNTFSTPIDLLTNTTKKGVTILDLHLNPIHLDILGLRIDTSSICLSIKAVPGSGNLLGNLLADVAHLLDQGTSLSDILAGLNSSQLSMLTDGLATIADTAVRDLSQNTSVSGASTNILNLSLGPVRLNILGLRVKLDNCANGPVTLDITATQGAGNLLGNLLSDLAHALDNNNQALVRSLEEQIASILGSVL